MKPARTLAIRLAIALGLAPAGCGGSYAGADPSQNPTADLPPMVRLAPVEMRGVRRFIDTTSYLESEHRVTVLSKVPGHVAEVLVDDGQAVAKGDLLARLDDREAKSKVEEAEVQLADRRVRLELAKLEVEASARRITQAEIERDKARAAFERNTQIDPGLISATELEDSKFALDSAEEAVKVATFNRSKAQLEVKAAENAIDELGTRLDVAKLTLGDHSIMAPIGGLIEERKVRGGEMIGTATELFVVVDQDDLVSYLRRPQRELPLIEHAREVTFTADAFGDREFKATIDFVSPVVDQATGSFRVRVRIARDDAKLLRPGMFLRARVLTEDERQALMVPKAAVLNEGDKSIVFVVRDGVARRVVLDTGLEERDHIECRNTGEDGLAPGDRVVVAGQHDLRDQVEVEVSRD